VLWTRIPIELDGRQALGAAVGVAAGVGVEVGAGVAVGATVAVRVGIRINRLDELLPQPLHAEKPAKATTNIAKTNH